MSGKQIAAVTAAVVLVLVLFMLPQVVVKKAAAPVADDLSHANPLRDSLASAGMVAKAVPPLPDSVLKQVADEKVALKAASTPSARALKAESIASKYRKAGHYDSSAVYFNAAADLNPDPENFLASGDAWFEAASVAGSLSEKGAFVAKARSRYQQAQKVTSFATEAKVKLALTYVESENPMQAIAMLREVLNEEPDNKSAILQLGLLSMRSGQYSKAVARFERLIELDSTNEQARFYLGQSLKETGNKPEARRQFLKLKQNASSAEVKSAAEEILKELDAR